MTILTAKTAAISENKGGKMAHAIKKENLKENFEEKIRLIEAALYVAGRPLDLKTLCSILGSRSEDRVRRLVRMLVEEYKQRNGALEIIELEDGRFVMQLKMEYADKVRKLAIRPLLTVGPLRTLSYIAYRQPVTQKQVIEVRGRHAYAHIRELLKMGFIARERSGKDFILKTTDFFADYFGLSRNLQVMKSQLKRIFEKRGEETLPASLEDEDKKEMARIEEQELKREKQLPVSS